MNNPRTVVPFKKWAEDPTAFDTSVVVNLGKELPLSADALAFVELFASLLPSRIESIRQALADKSPNTYETTLLSLQVGAIMAGARELQVTTTAALTHQGHQADRITHWIGEDELINRLEDQAATFRDTLRRFLANNDNALTCPGQ